MIKLTDILKEADPNKCPAPTQNIELNLQNRQKSIKVGQLGYCRFLKFKCAAARTCDTWVVGGPIS